MPTSVIVTTEVTDQAGRRRWTAHFDGRPELYGAGAQRTDAIAALVVFCIGELVLRNPHYVDEALR